MAAGGVPTTARPSQRRSGEEVRRMFDAEAASFVCDFIECLTC